MDAAPRIVVWGDEEIQRRLLSFYLGGEGFHTTEIGRAEDLHALLRDTQADLVMLDLQQPDDAGIGLARQIRKHAPQTGIIMVAAATEAASRVRGLDAGADDFIAKPFDPRELLARVRSVLRRLRPAELPPRVRVGRCVLDMNRRELLNEGTSEHLAGADFALLRAFVANPYRPLEPDWLAQVADGEAAPAGSPIAVRVEALRRRVEHDPADPQTIRTVADIGYMFVPARD